MRGTTRGARALHAVMTHDSLAWLLFACGLGGTAASTPLFVALFRHLRASAKPPVRVPPVPVMLFFEALKVALFSGFAAWAGARFAAPAGLDAPVFRALLDHDAGTATASLAVAAAAALPAGAAAIAVEGALARAFEPFPSPRRAPMSAIEHASGVFYMVLAVEPWFRWGILALALSALHVIGVPSHVAAVLGAASAAVAYGVFAIPSTMRAYPDAPPAARARRALLVGGVPSVFFGLAAVWAGLEAAILAQAIAFAWGAVVRGRRADETRAAPARSA